MKHTFCALHASLKCNRVDNAHPDTHASTWTFSSALLHKITQAHDIPAQVCFVHLENCISGCNTCSIAE